MLEREPKMRGPLRGPSLLPPYPPHPRRVQLPWPVHTPRPMLVMVVPLVQGRAGKLS